MNFDDFIYVKDNVISKKICNDIINRYESDNRKQHGMVGIGSDKKIVDSTLKTSTDLLVSEHEEWKDIDNILCHVVTDMIQDYINHTYEFFNKLSPRPRPFHGDGFSDSGYNVKGYEPGGYFHWHDDFAISETGNVRMIAMLIYLNDIGIGGGGYTEFISGKKVRPSAGRILMFPSTWNFIHRGVSPKKNKKYIISTYLYQ